MMNTFYMINVSRKMERRATWGWNTHQARWIHAAMRELYSSGMLPSCHMDSCSRVTVVPWWHLQVHYQHVAYEQLTWRPKSQSRMTLVVPWRYETFLKHEVPQAFLKHHAVTWEARSQICMTHVVPWRRQKILKWRMLLAFHEITCKFKTSILLSVYCCLK